MNQIETILKLAEVFGVARGIAEATVSSLAFKDGKRIKSIRAGADIGSRSAERAVQWFSTNWPEGAEWPKSIVRPEPVAQVTA